MKDALVEQIASNAIFVFDAKNLSQVKQDGCRIVLKNLTWTSSFIGLFVLVFRKQELLLH